MIEMTPTFLTNHIRMTQFINVIIRRTAEFLKIFLVSTRFVWAFHDESEDKEISLK